MMNIPEQFKLKNTIKLPTTIIVGGLTKLGLEITDSLIEQGGYVVLIDSITPENVEKLSIFDKNAMISFLDYTSIPHLEDDIRRLDYVFYFNHDIQEFTKTISTQEFLTFSNYLDAVLSLTSKFEARFLLSTSIKVNQILLSESEVGLNYGVATSVSKVYTEAELQRYAEGLVMEYGEKAELDVRIVRLGEIIGEEMDFQHLTTFTRLILQAVQNKFLELEQDGLSQDWYIHLLDAAYALIKAQFSKGTKQKIFSASYDTAYSQLSIAYKIQEVSEEQTEIRFIKQRNNLPPLKLYKPAQSLSDIGWMPKITLTKAVQESIASAKIFLVERNVKGLQKDGSTLGNKLLEFLNLAQSGSRENQSSGDILDELSDRGVQRSGAKQEKLELATSSLRRRRKSRVRTRKEKSQDTFWRVFSKLAGFVTILQRKSPLEIGLLIFSFLLLILTYFLVLSPAIFIARNALEANSHLGGVESAIFERRYADLRTSSEDLAKAAKDIENVLEEYKLVADYTTLEEEFRTIQTVQTGLIQASEAIVEISDGLAEIQTYTTEFKNNTQLRTSTTGYLSIETNGLDFTPELQAIEAKKSKVTIGNEKLKKSITLLNTVDTALLPEFLAEKIVQIRADLFIYSQQLESTLYEKELGEVLGGIESKTHLILLEDNSRLTPQGGELVAYALVTFDSGSISEIIVQTFNDTVFSIDQLSIDELREINATRFQPLDSTTVKVQDFSTIRHTEEFNRLIKSSFESTFSHNIDGIIIMNIESLDSLVKALNQPISINGVVFGEGTIINTLALNPSVNQSLEQRHRIIAQLLANVIFHYSNDLRNTYPILVDEFKNDGIRSNFSSSAIQDLLSKETTITLGTDSYFDVHFFVDDIINTNLLAPLDVNIALETNIQDDLIINNSATISFSSQDVGKDLSICLPLKISGSTINFANQDIPSLRSVVNITDSEQCIVTRLLSENSFTISWQDRLTVPSDQEDFDYKLGVGSVQGANTTFDHKVTVDSSLNITGINPAVSFNPKSVGYNTRQTEDRVVTIELEQQ